MSEYLKVKTAIKADHLDCLVAALQDIQPAWKGKVERHPGQGAPLMTYLPQDQRGQRAQVIVRRTLLGGASNDLGFAVQPDGSVEAIIGDWDRGKGYDDAWLGRVTQAYAFRVTEKQAAKAGLTATKTVQPNGSWRVVLKKRPVLAGRSW